MGRQSSRWVRTGLALVALSGCTESPVGPAFGPQTLALNPDVVPVAIESAVTLDGSAGVNPITGVAVVSGTLSCASPASVTLNVALSQSQKLRRVTTVVQASDAITIDCTSKHFWSIALTSASGGFQAGEGAASVATDGTVGLPQQTSAGVKLYWARK
jgi:hypothetical protein